MKSFGSLVRVLKFMGKRRFIYLTAILFMSSSQAMFTVMSSLLMKNVVDAAQTGNTDLMIYMIIWNVVGGLASLVVFAISSIVYNVEAKKAVAKLRKVIFHHEIRLPYCYYEQHHSGEMMSEITYDLDKTGGIYGSKFRRTVAPVIQVLVYMIPMLILNWQVTICLVIVNVSLIIINGLFMNPMKKVTYELSGINGVMTEKLSNLLQGMEQARMNKAGSKTVSEFETENEHFAKADKKLIRFCSCLESLSSGFDMVCALVFLLLGVYFTGKGITTFGALAAIYAMYGMFSSQFVLLGKFLPQLASGLANAEKLFDFMKIEEEPDSWYEKNGADEEVGNADPDLELEIKNLRFGYKEKKMVLDGFEMKASRGENVALIGHSGCGKTTVSKLLMGLYPAESGDIIIDGKSIFEMNNSELRGKIAYVPQEPYLFDISILENIRLGRTDASDEEVHEAACKAHADEFIVKLKDGYDTIAGERGNLLSGGQKQRIAIARAILKDAPILLMDEATSALDNESEILVNEAIKSLKDKKTVITIAHRPSTIALANKIVNVLQASE